MPGLGSAFSPVGNLCNLVLGAARYWVRRKTHAQNAKRNMLKIKNWLPALPNIVIKMGLLIRLI